MAAGFAAGLLVAPTHATFAGANGRIAFASDLHAGPAIISGAPGSLETDVHSIAPVGTARVRLTDSPGADGIVAWSPDGSRIAFVSSRDGNSEIYVMNPDGTGAVRMTHNPAADTQPDGNRVAFTSTRSGASAIYTIDPDGSDIEKITADRLEAGQPDWSPDGTSLGGPSPT